METHNLLTDTGTADVSTSPDLTNKPGTDQSWKKSLSINSSSDLKAAIKRWKAAGTGSDEMKQFITERAKALSLSGFLPAEWGVQMEIMKEAMTIMDIWITTEELEAESKFVSAATRKKDAAKGVALPDGSFPIPNKDFLRRAIQSIGRAGAGKRARVKAHIIKRARALGATSMLPEGWVTAEENINELVEEMKLPETFQSILVLDGDVPAPLILEQTEAEKEAGTLKVKMPFYIGESIAKPPHIPAKVYFPTSLLSETIAEGLKQIKAGKQPLTVYARHNHALSNDYLPIGGIVGLEQEGRTGYVILEIEPTTQGKDAQILLRKGKLNAVSLRSGPKRFEMEEVRVNGEAMYKPTKLLLDGVDFAPDSPAMPTYGLEILTAEAKIEPVTKEKEVIQQVEPELTLEAVRARPDIVEEIEKPFLKRLDEELAKNKTLTAEVASLNEKVSRNDLIKYVEEMASKHPKKDEALKVFLELAEQCKTKEEFSAKVLPYFVDAAAAIKPAVTAETAQDRLKRLFQPTPSQSITAETEDNETEDDDKPKFEKVGALEVPN